jgi:hypothetical protein
VRVQTHLFPTAHYHVVRTSTLKDAKGGPLQVFPQEPSGKFFSKHTGSCLHLGSTWLNTFLTHKPVIELLLNGKSADSHSLPSVRSAIKWWNREITRHLKRDLSHVQIEYMSELSADFEDNASNLRLGPLGSPAIKWQKSRRDYLGFATKLSDCLEFPGKAENKVWLEVLKYRYRHGQLDSLQESMAETAYPGFCTEKAIMDEKCCLFEENLKQRLSDMGNPTNQNWLRNYSSMARMGKLHPDYVRIMARYGLPANRRSFKGFLKEYLAFKEKHGEPRQRKAASHSELGLAHYANSLRHEIKSDPQFPAWKMKQLFEADFPVELGREKKG